MLLGTLEELLSLKAMLLLEPSAAAKVASGIVAGCRYLHEASPPRTAELSAHRVLVDANYEAKLRLRLRLGAERRPGGARRDHGDERTVWDPPEVLLGGERSPASDGAPAVPHRAWPAPPALRLQPR